MRLRDARAILFWIATTLFLVLVAQAAGHRWVITAIAAVAYSAVLLSRPRMIRVIRRLFGERWERNSGYFIEG